MRISIRNIFGLLLVLGALLGVSACSLGGSKISKGDVNKLNSANATVTSISDEYQQGISLCASKVDQEGCMMKLFAKLGAEEQSVADTYEQVAKGAHGSCQTALRAAGENFHAAAVELKAGKVPTATYARMKAKSDEVVRACKLKRKK
jgi:hypothetical protein